MGRESKRHAAPYEGWVSGGASGGAEERSRRNRQFGRAELALVEKLLRKEWSPEQVSGYLRRRGELLISHEKIYRQVWRDLKKGGTLHLHLHLRCAQAMPEAPTVIRVSPCIGAESSEASGVLADRSFVMDAGLSRHARTSELPSPTVSVILHLCAD